jgi:hypothetical protein
MLRRGRNREEAVITERMYNKYQAIAFHERGRWVPVTKPRTAVPLTMIPISKLMSIVCGEKLGSISQIASYIAVNPYSLAVYGNAKKTL